jgi:hypothetical protein
MPVARPAQPGVPPQVQAQSAQQVEQMRKTGWSKTGGSKMQQPQVQQMQRQPPVAGGLIEASTVAGSWLHPCALLPLSLVEYHSFTALGPDTIKQCNCVFGIPFAICPGECETFRREPGTNTFVSVTKNHHRLTFLSDKSVMVEPCHAGTAFKV